MARKGLVRDGIAFIRDVIMSRFYPDPETPRQLTAHHEAGHAVAAVVYGVGFDNVSVVHDERHVRTDRARPEVAPSSDRVQPR